MKSIFSILIAFAFTSGCATMSEKECKNGDWQSVGRKDGEKGYESSRISDHAKACEEYGVIPNKDVYIQGYKEGFNTYCNAMGIKAGEIASIKNSPTGCKSLSSFKTGYNIGLASFCTEDNGFRIGKIGGSNKSKSCPKSTASLFLTGYKAGLMRYCTRKNGFYAGRSGLTYNYHPHRCSGKGASEIILGFEKGKEYANLKSQIATNNKQIKELESKIKNKKTSNDLRKYLENDVAKLKTQNDVYERQTIKIEGYIGL